MDSRLKGLTIAGVVGIMVLVLLVVVYVNRSQIGRGNASAHNTTQTTQSAQDGATQSAQMEGGGRKTFEGTQLGDDLSAFLQQEDFFDRPKTKYEEYLEKRNTLSLILTSVEKDLRVKIVDFAGKLVTGEKFEIAVEGKGDYTDMDEDGIIYIPYLKSGDYYVALKEREGYTVPENAARVNVKEQVEYIAIDDISALIKTEDEIDPSVDDTKTQEADEEADETEVRKLRSPGDSTQIGIDVSKWNKEIDWEKVKEAGVQFAIIRCGYRGYSTGSLVIDPYFEQNIKGAEKAGINVGIYFFTQALDEVEAVEEASMVLSLIKHQYITYPVFIDTEGAGGNGRADKLDVEKRTAVCKAFCSTIENAGYDSGVYASKNWFNNRLTAQDLERFKIWLAEYRNTPTYEGVYDMWQYTSKGSVDGIEGNVDLSLSYLDVAAVEAEQ